LTKRRGHDRMVRMYSPRKAAKLLEVKPTTITRWIREGKLKATKVGRVWRIREDELDKLIAGDE
jgi:excisionase family DNA binding protein